MQRRLGCLTGSRARQKRGMGRAEPLLPWGARATARHPSGPGKEAGRECARGEAVRLYTSPRGSPGEEGGRPGGRGWLCVPPPAPCTPPLTRPALGALSRPRRPLTCLGAAPHAHLGIIDSERPAPGHAHVGGGLHLRHVRRARAGDAEVAQPVARVEAGLRGCGERARARAGSCGLGPQVPNGPDAHLPGWPGSERSGGRQPRELEGSEFGVFPPPTVTLRRSAGSQPGPDSSPRQFPKSRTLLGPGGTQESSVHRI